MSKKRLPFREGGEAPRVARYQKTAGTRPVCYHCEKTLPMESVWVDKDGQHAHRRKEAVAREFRGWGGYGFFCTLRCAAFWANWLLNSRHPLSDPDNDSLWGRRKDVE